MAALLGTLRREMNGAAADAMRYDGRPYGLNYGVSLPTIRSIARREPSDDAFARYLFGQDIRELRLAALEIADPDALIEADFDFWGRGLINSEVAEVAARWFLGRSPQVGILFDEWMRSADRFRRYAALMALSCAEELPDCDRVLSGMGSLADDPLEARGCVALSARLIVRPEDREAVIRFVDTLPGHAAAAYVRDELEWRLRYV